jgi:hypothetical protein
LLADQVAEGFAQEFGVEDFRAILLFVLDLEEFLEKLVAQQVQLKSQIQLG